MCGIVGFYLKNQINDDNFLCSEIKKMNHQILHRGPDSGNIWRCKRDKVYLGHRRLSIIDLSKNGNQPMHSSNNRFVIVFNGEIYNFRELKEELKNVYNINFTNNTDTSVLLECLNIFGIDKTLSKIEGMFAFALWDKREKNLYLVRDRIGKKPLYWGYLDNGFIFSSEIKSIFAYSGFNSQINFEALSSFFKFSYIDAPQSIFEKIYKLEPGFYLEISKNFKIKKTQYWNIDRVFITSNNKVKDKLETQDCLENLLEDSVKKRLISDVPLGVMLSGGIDSSLITALAQKNTQTKIKTFSIGFNEKLFDESKHAKNIADILGTDHTEIKVDGYSILDLISKLPDIYDEPFADSSQIPTFIISKQLKRQVTVALSGDGGDEVFGGYSRYVWGRKFAFLCKNLPIGIRRCFSSTINLFSADIINSFASILPLKIRPPNFGDRVYKIADIIKSESDSQIYSKLVSQTEPNTFMYKKFNNEDKIRLTKYPGNYDISSAMQYTDFKTYLPGDILVKVDRASMANGLEVRSPLLDHRVVEYAWKNLDQSLKIGNNKGKIVLRRILEKYLPKKSFERPKMGFGIPISEWLRGPLKVWMTDLLSFEKIKRQGIIKPEIIHSMIKDHLDCKRNFHYQLWTILMFQAWYDKWSSG